MIPELIGYADRISVAPGGRVAFKVSTTQPFYEISFVRLIRGDPSPPGFREELVAEEGSRVGRRQFASPGSYGLIDQGIPLPALGSISIQMWVWPTAPGNGAVQGLLSQWSASTGFALVLSEIGDLGLWLGDGNSVARVYSGRPLRRREWYFISASFDQAARKIVLTQIPMAGLARDDSAAIVARQVEVERIGASVAPLLIGTHSATGSPLTPPLPRGGYNGKIDHPMLVGRALDSDELGRIREGGDRLAIAGGDLIAAWDFSGDQASAQFVDRGHRRLNGTLVNMPMRAMSSHNWRGEEYDFKHAPEQYAAVHFHDDDLEDCRWETDFEWQVPASSRSGYYAARLRSGVLEDHIPFFVRPVRHAKTARVAVLAPTMTYLAYANERLEALPLHAAAYTKRPMIMDPLDHYLLEHPEFAMSIYDVHSDGSGCCFSTHLRPITNMRPKYRQWQVAGSRHLGADLSLIDWLEEKAITHEVITDHDLDAEGQSLLETFNVVLTVTHPEYWSTRMLNALRGYLDTGGRLMYLGGNGFYWVTGVERARRHVIEVRRGLGGTRAWNTHPAELYMSTTGELGGLWRHRGMAPNRIVGIGFAAMGYDAPSPGYQRRPGSFDERAAFIFEGIGAGEIIGDFGSVLGSAAADEIDRVDFDLGTPPHTLVLATAEGYGYPYMPVVEDHLEMSPIIVSAQQKNVRADMVYFETPNDGAVFSVGSMTWCSSLAHNRYDNNVSRITENVLRQFMGD